MCDPKIVNSDLNQNTWVEKGWKRIGWKEEQSAEFYSEQHCMFLPNQLADQMLWYDGANC